MFQRLHNTVAAAGTTTTTTEAATSAGTTTATAGGGGSGNGGSAALSDLYLRPLPYLDVKWLRADLIGCLRNSSNSAVLWNHLIQDCELVSSSTAPLINAQGQLSYLGDDGKHYCGYQQLNCACCQPDYCGPLSACNCDACRPLDSDTAIKRLTSQSAQQQQQQQHQQTEQLLNSWLWSEPPKQNAKFDCQRSLIGELHELSLRAAGNSLSAQQLRMQLFIYERYFVALRRSQQSLPASVSGSGSAATAQSQQLEESGSIESKQQQEQQQQQQQQVSISI